MINVWGNAGEGMDLMHLKYAKPSDYVCLYCHGV